MIKLNFTILNALMFLVIGLLFGRACRTEPTTLIETKAMHIPCDSASWMKEKYARELLIDSLRNLKPEVIVKVVHDTVTLTPKSPTKEEWDWGWEEEKEWDWDWDDEYWENDNEVSFIYRDKWATINFDWPDISYTVLDSLSINVKKERRSDILSIESHNPNTIINHLEYEIPYKPMGFGFQTGVMFDGKVRPYVGLGLSWDFVRF